MLRTWDYLVVGAGAAGGLLAAGLASASGASVLVLDAGLTSGRRGHRAAVRPHVLEFDSWVRAGSADWSPEDILPHFRRLEADHDFGSASAHGLDGPVPVLRTPEPRWTPEDRAFRLAALHKGHPWAPDHNAAGALGVSPLAVTATDAGPVDTAGLVRALLERTSGVDLIDGAVVERLLWSRTRVIGVEAMVAGSLERFSAGEILVCAGGLDSPLLLQRSGVGPASLLRRAGVEPRVDLPVGQGLQVHPLLDIVGIGTLRDSSVSRAGAPVTTVSSPYDSTTPASFGMFARWNTGLEGATSGDLMAWTAGLDGSQAQDGVVLRITGAVAQAVSRGDTWITGPCSSDAHRVDPGLLADPLDRYRMTLVAGHLADMAASQGLEAHLLPVNGGDPLGLPDVAWDLGDWVQRFVRSSGHYASGCRMGALDDQDAVVGPNGCVRGVQGLRVADASIMPSIVKSDPWLTSAAIGSRMAELVATSSGVGM